MKTVVGHSSLVVGPKLDAAAAASEYRQNLDEPEDSFESPPELGRRETRKTASGCAPTKSRCSAAHSVETLLATSLLRSLQVPIYSAVRDRSHVL